LAQRLANAHKARKRRTRGIPKRREDACKDHAAVVAVLLSRHHRLPLKCWKSATSKLLQLAAIIYGEPLNPNVSRNAKGWYQRVRKAIGKYRRGAQLIENAALASGSPSPH